MYLRAVGKRTNASLEGLFVAFNNEIPTVFLGVPIAERQHFLEFPFGVNVHQGEGGTTRSESLLCQAYHDAGILTDAVKHHWILKFRRHFADDVDGLGFEFFQVAETIVFRHNRRVETGEGKRASQTDEPKWRVNIPSRIKWRKGTAKGRQCQRFTLLFPWVRLPGGDIRVNGGTYSKENPYFCANASMGSQRYRLFSWDDE